MTINIFEFATRNKLRVASPRGDLTVEHLWDVPLRSRDDFNLNTIAKAISKLAKDASEENFVDAKENAQQTRVTVMFDVVKYVIAVKINEEAAATKRAANKVEREQLLAILAEKQLGKLSELSETELKKRIEALE